MLTKYFLRSKQTCLVTFSLPAKIAGAAKTVHLVGDFNEWNHNATPMKIAKNGMFSVTLVLKTGKKYEFRYLLDGTRWENDWEADQHIPVTSGDPENSVVFLY